MSLVSAQDHGQGSFGAPAAGHTWKLSSATQYAATFRTGPATREEQQGQDLSRAVHPEPDVPPEGSQETVHQPESADHPPLRDGRTTAIGIGYAQGASCGEALISALCR